MLINLSEDFDNGAFEISERGFRRLWKIYKTARKLSKFLDKKDEELGVINYDQYVIVNFNGYGKVLKKAKGIEEESECEVTFDDYALRIYQSGLVELLGVYNGDDFTKLGAAFWIQRFFDPNYLIKFPLCFLSEQGCVTDFDAKTEKRKGGK
ncbi:MAG: hypothetical protein LBQ52_04945 [Helicobacteraceae bacterium]|jgi:hypothetical protein|nr:hypothetical protein [Helicobacteraceae bacterium]